MSTQRASCPDIASSSHQAERLIRSRRPFREGAVLVGVLGGTRQGRVAVSGALQPSGTEDTAGVVFLDDASVDVVAVLFLTEGGSRLTGPELELMRTVGTDGPPLLLVLTGIDRHRRWHDVLTSDLASLRELGVPVEPFAISTALHALATSGNDRELDLASGVPALAARLHDLAEQGDADHPADEGRGAVTRPDPAWSGRGGTVDPPDRRQDRRRKPARRPDDDGPSWQQVLGDGVAAASSDVDFDLRTRVRTVLAEAERAVDVGDPDRAWDTFDGWLRDRLVYEARQTQALLTTRVENVAAELGARLGGTALTSVVRPLPAPAELFGHVPMRRPNVDGRPLATRGQALLRSAYGGILMSFVLPRLAGLRIPVWVLAAAAAATAVALVVATVLGERKRRLDRTRSQARTIVRHCTDGFLLSAGKHTRDALRSAQQQLRDDCGARAKQPRVDVAVVPPRPWRPPAVRRADHFLHR
jgi:hypothetical protein